MHYETHRWDQQWLQGLITEAQHGPPKEVQVKPHLAKALAKSLYRKAKAQGLPLTISQRQARDGIIVLGRPRGEKEAA